MKKQYVIYPVLMLLISVVFIFSTSKNNETVQSIEIFDVFDTYSEISVISDKDKSEVLSLCSAYLKEKDKLWGSNNPDSEIYGLNKSSGEDFVVLSFETIDILQRAQEESKNTNGYFDITTGPVINLWGIGNDPKVPSDTEIAGALAKSGSNLLKIDKNTSSAMLTKKGASVNLGAIAKGYATKQIVNILRDDGISSALVNLGGNTYALGTFEDKPWRIGIQDPKAQKNLIGTLSVSDTSVITSGNYFRYFEKDNVRYHHIMNPFTGRPSDSGLTSVTIINPDPVIADVLSTACFVAGYEESLPIIKSTHSQAIFVTEDNLVCYSKELSPRFEHDNQAYKYIEF